MRALLGSLGLFIALVSQAVNVGGQIPERDKWQALLLANSFGDLKLPQLSSGEPAAGRRVAMYPAAATDATDATDDGNRVHHRLYLPSPNTCDLPGPSAHPLFSTLTRPRDWEISRTITQSAPTTIGGCSARAISACWSGSGC